MGRREDVNVVLLSASFALAGGGFGGNPPAVESLILGGEQFKALALDAINNPDKLIQVNGKLARPLMIDLKSRTIQFESTDDNLTIEVSHQKTIED
jgi:hypothetical protein